MKEEFPGIRASLEGLRGRSDLLGAEIGVGVGFHAEDILQELNMEYLFLVDPYQEYESGTAEHTAKWAKKAFERLKEYRDRANLSFLLMGSVAAAELFPPHTLDFVYIDGDHRYEAVKADIAAWYPVVKPGGILGGHDYPPRDSQKKLTDAVDEFCERYGYELHTRASDRDWWIVKYTEENL